MFVATRVIKVGESEDGSPVYRMPGELVPEAETWAHWKSYVDHGWIAGAPGDPGKAALKAAADEGKFAKTVSALQAENASLRAELDAARKALQPATEPAPAGA